tara:strand:+ start:626 stop:1060 length:435 start_codon:yes stop_codon:yes gene_type:complete
MDDINLIYPAVLTNLITLLLFLNSKSHDKCLLFIMIIGQIILISGESDKNLDKIQLSHILFVLTILIGSVYFKEKRNLIFIGILIILRFITRYIYDDCLFNMSSNHYEFDIETNIHKYINWNIIFMITLIIISYRLKDKIFSNL